LLQIHAQSLGEPIRYVFDNLLSLWLIIIITWHIKAKHPTTWKGTCNITNMSVHDCHSFNSLSIYDFSYFK